MRSGSDAPQLCLLGICVLSTKIGVTLVQATIAEMVKDEEEDAMRSAAVSGREAPKSDAFAASFTSEEDDDVPARSKGRRRWRPEPARQRAGAPGRQSHPPSTTASPVKVEPGIL